MVLNNGLHESISQSLSRMGRFPTEIENDQPSSHSHQDNSCLLLQCLRPVNEDIVLDHLHMLLVVFRLSFTNLCYTGSTLVALINPSHLEMEVSSYFFMCASSTKHRLSESHCQ